MMRVLCALAIAGPLAAAAEPSQIYFQSHRGGMNEVPENTLAAMEHAWSIPGGVPETDLRTTSDGVLVCLHDDTPARTTNASAPWADTGIDEAPLEQVRTWDAGAWFDPKFAGEQIPTLDEIFARMQGHPERELYLDLKGVQLEQVTAAIDKAGLREQVLFVHGSPRTCARLAALWPGARVMTWISAPPEAAKKQFERMAEHDFHGLAQLQFHLHAVKTEPEIEYGLDWEYLAECVTRLQAHHAVLQVRLFEFDAVALRRLIGLGIHWYVTDEPRAFRAALDEALAEE